MIAYHAEMKAPRELWRSIVGDQQAPTSETHPDDHSPLWGPPHDGYRTCVFCGHVDAGGRWDRFIITAVMLGVVCFFAVWIGYWAYSLIP